jgi:glycosyltransferase involved in cell wall biosynthesis
MRIGVDATCWSNRRGYGRFTRSLLTAALALDRLNRYVFFVDEDSKEFPLPQGGEIVRVATHRPTIQAAAADGRRSLKDLWAIRRAMDGEQVDLFFFPSVYSYVPLLNPAPKLVTIHDAIPELYPELVFPTWRSRFFWNMKVKLSCAQARLVLTVSDYSARHLAEKLKIPSSQLRIVNEAGDPAFRPLERPDGSDLLARLGLPAGARLLVYVGGFSPHKNLQLLVDVFGELRARPSFDDLRLVLAGDYESDTFYSCYQQVRERVERSGLRERVVFAGHLGDEELVVLLNLAHALALPSFVEGFGLPAVEAAACGTPAVVTTRSPLPELLGEGVIAVDPNDRAGWITALARVLCDAPLRSRMRQAALAAAGRLSWMRSAEQLLEIFEEVGRARAAA